MLCTHPLVMWCGRETAVKMHKCGVVVSPNLDEICVFVCVHWVHWVLAELNAYHAPLTTHSAHLRAHIQMNIHIRIELLICTHINYSLFYNDAIRYIIASFFLCISLQAQTAIAYHVHIFTRISITLPLNVKDQMQKLKIMRHSNANLVVRASIGACRNCIKREKKVCLNSITCDKNAFSALINNFLLSNDCLYLFSCQFRECFSIVHARNELNVWNRSMETENMHFWWVVAV